MFLIASAIALLSIHATGASAQPRPRRNGNADATVTALGRRVLILDMTPTTAEKAGANRVFSLSERQRDALMTKLSKHLDSLVDTLASKDRARLTQRLVDFLRARDTTERLAELASNRWMSQKGDHIDIYVLHANNRTPELEYKEEERATQITKDLAKLVAVAQKLGTLNTFIPPKEAQAPNTFTHRTYYLTKTRSTLTVTATLRAAPPSAREAAPEDKVPERLTTSVVTGAAEHFFLSANAAFTQVRQIKYNEASRTLEPDKKPKEFLIGVDYAIADLLADDGAATSFIDGVYIGFLVEGSNKPFNQIGSVFGFRRNLPWLEKYLTFDTVSPYVGLVWVRNDHVVSGTTFQKIQSRYGRRGLITGLSLNLDKALGWLSSNKPAAAGSTAAKEEQ